MSQRGCLSGKDPSMEPLGNSIKDNIGIDERLLLSFANGWSLREVPARAPGTRWSDGVSRVVESDSWAGRLSSWIPAVGHSGSRVVLRGLVPGSALGT